MYRRVYLRLIIIIYSVYSTYIPRRILGIIIMEIFNDELSECRRDVSAFNFRRSMCRPSKIDYRCVDLRRSVSIFEDQRSMCRPSKIDGVVDLRRPMIDVKLCCQKNANTRTRRSCIVVAVNGVTRSVDCLWAMIVQFASLLRD